MKKILALLVALILCLSFVTGCTDDGSETAQDNSLDETILTKIGDYEVSQAFYNFCYYMVYLNWSQYYGPGWMNQTMDDGTTMSDAMKMTVREQVEQLTVASVIAKDKYGITNADAKDKAEEQKSAFVASFGNQTEYAGFLTEGRTTDKAVDTYFELYEIFDLLSMKISEEGQECYVTDEEVKTEFDAQYYGKLKVQHILISTVKEDRVTPLRTDDEALKIAAEVFEKLDAGEDFDSLIEKYDEDPGMTPGNYYVFGDGEMVPEFETASKELAPGEYTKEAVKTDYGYHIIKRYSLDETSDEYLQCKLYLVKSVKIVPVITAKTEELGITWDTEAIDKYIDAWAESLNTSQPAIQ